MIYSDEYLRIQTVYKLDRSAKPHVQETLKYVIQGQMYGPKYFTL